MGSALQSTDFEHYKPEVVLSDVLRSSNLNDNQQLHTGIKSPFQLFPKDNTEGALTSRKQQLQEQNSGSTTGDSLKVQTVRRVRLENVKANLCGFRDHTTLILMLWE